MKRENNSSKQERDRWLQDCVAMFREAVLARRVATDLPTPVCIEQVAIDFGMKESRGKKLFYNELLTMTREKWLSMKYAALRNCDADVRRLQERLEARRVRQRQYELELLGDTRCGSSGGNGSASAPGEHTGTWMPLTDGRSDY